MIKMNSKKQKCHSHNDTSIYCFTCGWSKSEPLTIPKAIREWEVVKYFDNISEMLRPVIESEIYGYFVSKFHLFGFNKKHAEEFAYYSRIAKAVQDAIDENRKTLEEIASPEVMNSGSYDLNYKIEIENKISFLEAMIKRAKQSVEIEKDKDE